MHLKKIKSDDLIFSLNIDDSGTNTFLSLDDYDWMNYRLKTRFRTNEMGILDVEFRYFGETTSRMTVK